jgi:hypothetical protein
MAVQDPEATEVALVPRTVVFHAGLVLCVVDSDHDPDAG